jgi:hypothetical protein
MAGRPEPEPFANFVIEASNAERRHLTSLQNMLAMLADSPGRRRRPVGGSL